MPHKKSGTNLGRPPKFSEPSSSITITLPDRILENLERIDDDRARAIVKCVEAALAEQAEPSVGYEVLPISADHGLLVLGPSSALRAIPWVHLVEIAPTRFLISVPAEATGAELELAILDLIDDLPEDQLQEKRRLMDLRQQLALARRDEQVSSRKIFLVHLSSKLTFSFLTTPLGLDVLAEGQLVAPLLSTLPM